MFFGFMLLCYHENPKRGGKISYACYLGKQIGKIKCTITVKKCKIELLFYQYKQNQNNCTKQIQNYY